ncbi:MAG: peptidylprolyl isomerase [Halobacteriovoraceae bacterium]|nr:peptidylprolyl isomerase [Halobacteriovoraceae bacterium]MBT5095557.1 peptidylprolyl isomerase [Halobacteriovoraceae bacterium]
MASKSDYKEELERLNAKVTTSLGEFTIELYAKECPETVWNFVNLAEGRQETQKEGPYYDGLIFHRVISGFMLQGGCPDSRGTGGPGYQFKDECHPELRHEFPGTLSMANAGPGTNGSQFFVTLAPTPHLDGRHTVFGKVIEGLDVVEKIGLVPTGGMDRPVEDVVMQKVEIIR